MSHQINLCPEVTIVLRLVQSLDPSFAENYLIQLLRADGAFGWKNPKHPFAPGFGALRESGVDRLRNIIQACMDQGWLEIEDTRSGKLRITRHGEDFLIRPSEFWIAPKQLHTPSPDKAIWLALQQVRRDIAHANGVPSFRIFTDYHLREIAARRPDSLEAFAAIPGIHQETVRKYGQQILSATRKACLRLEAESLILQKKRAAMPAAQAVKTLFLSGACLSSIAASRGIKPATVGRTLEMLHRTGELNLLPWIETVVEPGVLAAGASAFQNHPQMRLLEAAQTLRLTITETRWCRLYAEARLHANPAHGPGLPARIEAGPAGHSPSDT